jgi:hypothetical protein
MSASGQLLVILERKWHLTPEARTEILPPPLAREGALASYLVAQLLCRYLDE